MNLCFIHGNFPGQFKDIAPSLAAKSGGRTIFLTLSDGIPIKPTKVGIEKSAASAASPEGFGSRDQVGC